MIASMFGFPTSFPSDSSPAPSSPLPPPSEDLSSEVAACRKRSNILLALTRQDLAEAEEWLERVAADAIRTGRHPSAR